MRARNIKPGFYANEELAECSIMARYIFPGLWMMADREGRLEDRPKKIKATLLPFDNADVLALLQELEQQGLIKRYEVEGTKYIWIPKFKQHQKPHPNEKASCIPAHPEDVSTKESIKQGQGSTGEQPRNETNVNPTQSEEVQGSTPIQPEIKQDTTKVESASHQGMKKDAPRYEASNTLEITAPADSLIPDSLILDSRNTSSSLVKSGKQEADETEVQPNGFEEKKKPMTAREAYEAQRKTEDTPGIEFCELREFYTANIRAESEKAGFIEYKQLRASGSWPGYHVIWEDLQKRANAQNGPSRYAVGLGRYFQEHGWTGPITPQTTQQSHANHGDFDAQDQQEICRRIAAKYDATGTGD